MFQAELTKAGYGTITSEIAAAGPFYYAEDYHQQYLAKNPNGYCGLGGTGVSCPIGAGVTSGALTAAVDGSARHRELLVCAVTAALGRPPACRPPSTAATPRPG